jgi:hypothetical protein
MITYIIVCSLVDAFDLILAVGRPQCLNTKRQLLYK